MGVGCPLQSLYQDVQNAPLTVVLSVPSRPRIQSGSEVATNDVARAGTSRGQTIAEVPAKSMSERKRRRRCSVTGPGCSNFRGLSSRKQATADRASATSALSHRAPPESLQTTARRFCHVVGRKLRDHIWGRGHTSWLETRSVDL